MRWILVALLVACDGPRPADAGPSSDGAPIDAPTGGPCRAFLAGEELGRVASPELTELSGLAASRLYDDVLYAHNDSGDVARVFLLGVDGAHLGTVTLDGAPAIDVEDIAVGPGPDGAPWVYAGDIGDNAARAGGTPREGLVVHRFPEPSFDPAEAPLARTVTAEALALRYPDAPHDAEALAVDPTEGDVYLLTKDDVGPSILYVARAPFAATTILEPLATVAIAPGSPRVTAMDLAPGGRGLLVRTENRVLLFERAPGEDWADALARAPLLLPIRLDGQGEAIAWRADGRAYFTASEGIARPIHAFVAIDPRCEPL